jgi:hypothetical protein
VQNIYVVPEASEVVASEFGTQAVDIWKAALGGRNLTEVRDYSRTLDSHLLTSFSV